MRFGAAHGEGWGIYHVPAIVRWQIVQTTVELRQKNTAVRSTFAKRED
jgi:hypothetical protein